MNTILQDLRFGLRQLRKSPGFAITVVLTLALGIGATTVVYSIVDAVLLRPLPFPHPDRLVAIECLEKATGAATRTNDTSYPNFFDWREQDKSFQSIASYKTAGYTLAGSGNAPARRVTGVMVSSDFFHTLGVQPALGRGFRRDEEQPGNRSAVIGRDLAEQVFGGSANALGKTLTLSDESYRVVGVLPKGFLFPLSAPDAQVWVTLAHDAEGDGASATQRGYNQLDVIGRLGDKVSLEQARAEMNAIQSGLAARYPEDDKLIPSVKLTPEIDSIVGDVRQPIEVLFAAVGFLLLIACVNAAGLLLTRAGSRLNEIAVRSALGASRGHLLRQLLIEALTLSILGGLLGVGLASLVLQTAPKFLPASLIRVQSIGMNGPVLAFAVLAALATGIVFGVAPAWLMSRLDPATALKDGGRGATAGRRQSRLHAAMVVAETALGLILIAGAGLLIRSFDRILRVDPGFDPQHLLTFRIATPDKRYDNRQRDVFFDRVLARLKSLPGVEAATGAFPMPLSGGNIRIAFEIDGQPHAPGEEPAERVSLVSPDFFQTMRIALKSGRSFTGQENQASGKPVAMVNEAFEKKYFGGKDAVGQHMRPGLGLGDTPPMREIVGVVRDVKRSSQLEPDTPEYYIPMEQAPVAPPAIALRVAGEPMSYENAVRSAVAELDPALPVYRMHAYSDDLARTTAQQRFQTILLAVFAAIALVLSAVGLYALLSYMVVQRRMELGLRLALGAQRADVLTLVMGRGLLLAGIGLAIGLGASVFATRFMTALLFGVKPLDFVTFGSASLVLLAVSGAACLVPAYRASRLDPMKTLRME